MHELSIWHALAFPKDKGDQLVVDEFVPAKRVTDGAF